MKFRTQFSEITLPSFNGEQGEPVEGFQPHAVESLSVLIARLKGGGKVDYHQPDFDGGLGSNYYDDFFDLADQLEEINAQRPDGVEESVLGGAVSESSAGSTNPSGVGEEPTNSQS